jgi:hypothetical protein
MAEVPTLALAFARLDQRQFLAQRHRHDRVQPRNRRALGRGARL